MIKDISAFHFFDISTFTISKKIKNRLFQPVNNDHFLGYGGDLALLLDCRLNDIKRYNLSSFC